MPPMPRFVSTVMRDIAREYARRPKAEITAIVERLEAMISDVQASQMYPIEWVIFRLSGETHDPMHTPTTIPAEELLRDLVAMSGHLCDAAGMTWADVHEGGAIDATSLCEQWRVSRKTLERYRTLGLAPRRVAGPGGRSMLAYMPAVVSAFQARHSSRLADASGFSRVDEAMQRRMIARARRYRATLRCSLNEAAARIAKRYGRSHEAVRQILRRHDATSPKPIFGRPATPASKRRAIALRAMSRGIEPAEIARRFGRSRASVVHLALQERAARLRQLELRTSESPAATAVTQAERALASPAVRTGLGAPAETDMLRVIAMSGTRGSAPGAQEEAARALAYRHLIDLSATGIAHLRAGSPLASDIDLIETRLRWAARLKAELVRSQMPLVLRTLSAQVGTDLQRLRSSDLRELLMASITAIGTVVDAFDPSRGGRLASPVGLAVNRVASRWVREHREASGATSRASPRVPTGAALPDWTRAVSPWQTWLEPPARVRERLDNVDPRGRDMLMRRMGWGGDPPRTLAEASAALGVTVMRGAIIERAAIRAAMAAGRGA